MTRISALALAALLAAAVPADAQTPGKTDCVEMRPSEPEPAADAGKGTPAGAIKDGPGTTGWSSGNSEAGIQKDGKAASPDTKQPETAKGLDPTKRPC